MRKSQGRTHGVAAHKTKKMFKNNFQTETTHELPSDSDCVSSEDFDENVAYMNQNRRKTLKPEKYPFEIYRYNVPEYAHTTLNHGSSFQNDTNCENTVEFGAQETERFYVNESVKRETKNYSNLVKPF